MIGSRCGSHGMMRRMDLHNHVGVRWFGASTVLAILTVIVSFSVAYMVNGNIFSTVRIVHLRDFGGTTWESLGDWELWRLASAQLIHVRWPHMLFNALCLLLLGSLLERVIGPVRLLVLWLVGGGIGTAISPVLIEYPFNVGTGASQAAFAFAGCALVLAYRGTVPWRAACWLVALAVGTGLALDLVFASYPKPGHVFSLCAGAGFGLVFSRYAQLRHHAGE